MISMASAGYVAASAATGMVLGAAMSYPARRLAHTDRAKRLLHPAILAALSAAILAALAWRDGGHPLVLVVDATLAAGLVPLAAIDLTEHRLPTWLLAPLYPILLALIATHGFINGLAGPGLRAVAGMALLFVFYLAIAVVSEQLGAGDVRLAGLLGLALGWHSWPALAVGTLIGLFAASAAGAIAIFAFRRPRDQRIPLGTALIAGALVALMIQPGVLA